MARGFRSGPDGLTARLDARERALLGRLFQDIIGLLEAESPGADEGGSRAAAGGGEPDPLEALVGLGAVEAPTDLAVRRLLPDGSEDEERAAEFRRFTDQTLREQKVAALRRAALAVEQNPVRLDVGTAAEFSRALNDVRLVLSTRLEITSEADARRVEKAARRRIRDTRSYMAVVYSFVSWLQDSLVQAMLLDLPPEEDARPGGPGQG